MDEKLRILAGVIGGAAAATAIYMVATRLWSTHKKAVNEVVDDVKAAAESIG